VASEIRLSSAVEVVACPEEACRFLVGSRRAEKRVAYARTLLAQIGAREERLGITRSAGLSAADLVSLARARAEAIA